MLISVVDLLLFIFFNSAYAVQQKSCLFKHNQFILLFVCKLFFQKVLPPIHSQKVLLLSQWLTTILDA